MFCGVIYHCAEIWSKENLIFKTDNELLEYNYKYNFKQFKAILD